MAWGRNGSCVDDTMVPEAICSDDTVPSLFAMMAYVPSKLTAMLDTYGIVDSGVDANLLEDFKLISVISRMMPPLERRRSY